MLSPVVIREIERLLADGNHSYRQIARRLGVSHGTVAAVAGGQRKSEGRLRREPGSGLPGGPRRCPSCGAKVHMPCRLCQTRELRAAMRLESIADQLDEPLGLQLKGEHQRRYAEVRMRRREARKRRPP